MVNKIAICAEACRLSYDDNAPGFFTVGDLRYGIYTQDGLTVLAIRGTANAENWGRDCSMLPGKSPKGYLAHSGFIGAYNDLVESGIFWKITTRTVVTGHSLG